MYQKEETIQKLRIMSIISTIFMTIVVLFIGIITLAIFIQTNVELWNEVGKDLWDDFTSWFKKTKIGMWYTNKKNGIEILSLNILDEGDFHDLLV